MTQDQFISKLKSFVRQKSARESLLAKTKESGLSVNTMSRFLDTKANDAKLRYLMFILEHVNVGVIMRSDVYTCIVLNFEDLIIALSCLREVHGEFLENVYLDKTKERKGNITINELFDVCKKLKTTMEFASYSLGK